MKKNIFSFFKKYWLPICFISGSAILFLTYINLAHDRDIQQKPFSQLENVFFQIFIFSLSSIGSYFFGKNQSKNNINLFARSAIRRVISLYSGVASIIKITEEKMLSDPEKIRITNNTLYLQMYQIDDAIKDWGEIVPDEVEGIFNVNKSKEEIFQK